MDSLLNDVEETDEPSAFAISLDSDEEAEEGASETLIANSVAADDEDQTIQGIVNFDPTVVGSMGFADLLKNKKSNDKTEVRPDLAKTEVRPEMAKTEIRPSSDMGSMDPSDILKSEGTVIGQDFSNEENSTYEATRIGSAPEDADRHTEFGELELEPMEANVVDLHALELQQASPGAESHEEEHDASAKTEIRPRMQASPSEPQQQPPVPKVPVSEQPVTQAEIEAAMSLFSSSPEALARSSVPPASLSLVDEVDENVKTQVILTENPSRSPSAIDQPADSDSQVGTVAISVEEPFPSVKVSSRQTRSGVSSARANNGDTEGTVAVTGFHVKREENLEGKVKVSVGKQGRSSGYSSWGGGVDGNLSQAENLRMAQEKILELENENERLRRQNEELIAASEILKERSDLMTSQLTEYKNDRDGLEQSFKNELTLLKNHVARKDAELKRAQFKVEELESRLKFDLKKIRVRERELENRLELVRAEKNAISKNKDEQILDLRRKMDIIQMEVDSYRQKCVELNKQIESSQDSFKRTTRALRLAMANLELQEENKGQLKKAE